MNRTLTLVPCLLLLAGLAFAQTAPAERVEFYADASMSACELAVDELSVAQIHMFHVGPEPAVSLAFAAPTPSCWTGATWLGDVISEPFLTLGNTHDTNDGLAISYTACHELPVYLGYMNFVISAPAQACCLYEATWIELHPGILSASCDLPRPELRYPGARGIIINPGPGCHCVSPVAVEETSWGKVKALYGD